MHIRRLVPADVGAYRSLMLVAYARHPVRSRHRPRSARTFLCHGGQSTGRLLVDAVLQETRACPGVRVVQLTVTEDNVAARTLYECCGFTALGIEPLAVALGSDCVSKVHMWCDLSAH